MYHQSDFHLRRRVDGNDIVICQDCDEAEHKEKDHRLAKELAAAHLSGDVSLAIKLEQALNEHRQIRRA